MQIKKDSVGFYILCVLVISLVSMFIFPNKFLLYRISNAAFSSGVILFAYGTVKCTSYLKYIGWFGDMGKWKKQGEDFKTNLPNTNFFFAIVIGLICIFISVVLSNFNPY